MEKQILQVLELHRLNFGEEIKKNPEMPDDVTNHELICELVEYPNRISQADNISDYALGITNAMYHLMEMAIECGIADRLPELFDAVHVGKMKTANSSDGTEVPPYIAPIIEKDFHEYEEFKDLVVKMEETDTKILEAHVLRNIKSRLRNTDLARFNSYLSDEKRLDKVVKVDYLGGGIEDRFAVVTVYGTEQEVKVDWEKLVNKQKSKIKKDE